MAIQQKFHVDDDGVRRLAGHGVAFGPVREVEYTYFGRDGTTSENLLVRISTHPDRSVLDLKERPARNAPWAKLETAIASAADAKAMLERFGFRVVATMRKQFRSWRNEFVVIDLEHVPGRFMVIEAKFEASRRDDACVFLRDIGFDPNECDLRSSVDIFLASIKEEDVR